MRGKVNLLLLVGMLLLGAGALLQSTPAVRAQGPPSKGGSTSPAPAAEKDSAPSGPQPVVRYDVRHAKTLPLRELARRAAPTR
ncbi:MAG: hypothetical protein D6796_04485, partial [Caldilineae bacterium]